MVCLTGEADKADVYCASSACTWSPPYKASVKKNAAHMSQVCTSAFVLYQT